MHYTPCVAPGWDNSPRMGKDAYVVRDLSMPLFRKQCHAARQSLHADLPLVLVEAWNEWGEGVFIAPDSEFGFQKLDIIREELAGMRGHHTHETPTSRQLSEWSILAPDELKKAAQRAKENYPLPDVKRTQPQASAGTANGQTSWDFTKAPDRSKIRWIGAEPQNSVDCASGKFTQGYAHCVLSEFKVPLNRVKAFRFRYSVDSPNNTLLMRLFWLTTKSGGVDGHFAIDFPAVADSNWHDVEVNTSDILNWSDSRGELVNFVLMADSGVNCIFKLQRFELIM